MDEKVVLSNKIVNIMKTKRRKEFDYENITKNQFKLLMELSSKSKSKTKQA